MAKVLVSVDDALLRRIDRSAQARGLSRSAYLADLAEQDLARREGPGRSPAVRTALTALDRLLAETPAGDSTDLIRSERTLR